MTTTKPTIRYRLLYDGKETENAPIVEIFPNKHTSTTLTRVLVPGIYGRGVMWGPGTIIPINKKDILQEIPTKGGNTDFIA